MHIRFCDMNKRQQKTSSKFYFISKQNGKRDLWVKKRKKKIEKSVKFEFDTKKVHEYFSSNPVVPIVYSGCLSYQFLVGFNMLI